MRVSNAASFNRTGRPIADLRSAITRIGYNMVRSAAMAFAMSQMRRNNKLEALQPRMNQLWERSTSVAAFAYVLARTCSRVNPDEAMLAGMMHGIGKLYIMTRAADHQELFRDEDTLNAIMDDWHAAVGKAILENWEFTETMSEAVGNQDDHARTDQKDPDLRDVLAVAILLALYAEDVAGLELALNGLPETIRLGLDEARIRAVMQAHATEVSALRDALGV
jgi:HD-like signal output (HDOD) protein